MQVAVVVPRDLTQAKLEFIIDRNDQTGRARFDFDQVTGVDLDDVFDGYNLHSVIRLDPPPAPATVASLRAHGTVKNDKLYFKSDGSAECFKALNPNPSKSGEGC